MADADSAQIQRVFEALRPICVRLIKDPMLPDVQMLHGMVIGVPSSALQSLQQYILFPLRLIIKEPQKRSQELCERTVQCMCIVLKQTSVAEWDMFSDLFSVLSILISCRSNVGKVAEISEELKLAVIQCLIALLHSADKQVTTKVYQSSFLPAMGHLVSLLLSAADKEKLRDLKMEAMECLLHLAQCQGDSWPTNPHAHDARMAFASFLPGIAMTICKVILGDSKQGQNVTVKAITVWYRVVTLVMSDKSSDQSKETSIHQSSSEGPTGPNGESLLVKRTKDWVEATARKLDILIDRIATMATNPHWKVRLAMVKFAKDLLFTCKSSLKESTPKLLELLVGLVGDEYSQVANLCQDTLKEISHSHMNGEDKQLVELLEDNLYGLMTVLPRLVRASDDSKKLSTLNLVVGYLKLLGPRISLLLHSAAHMKRLSLALVQVVEFDTREVKILEDVNPDSSSRLEEYRYYKTRRKYFKHFTDEAVYQAFVKICRLLGQYGNITLLVDHFLDLFHNNSVHRKQAILFLNELMLGTLETGTPEDTIASWDAGDKQPKNHLHNSDEVESTVGLLLQEYLSDDNWHLPTSIDQSQSTSSTQMSSNWLVTSMHQREPLSLVTINSNALLICLFLEGIGAFSQVLGAGFNSLLMDCLYQILEKLADEKTIISQTAYNTLADISSSCGYSSIPDLLCNNADYLVDAISLKLRHLAFHPRAPSVLKVTLQHSNATMLPILEDTINEILSTLDQYYDDKAALFFKVLHTLIASIVRWFPEETSQSVPKKTCNLSSPATEDVKMFFLYYHRQNRIADGKQVDDMQDVETEIGNKEAEEEMEEDVKKELPMHVQIVKLVLERCLHFVSSKDPRLRLLVLDVIQNGLLALATHKDELLPLVHRLWPGFIQRFTDTELLVTCKACETLYVMGDTCGDFLQKRVVKDVWPKLMAFMKSQAKISIKTGPAYKHTSAHKLQRVILNGIGPLCLQLDIGESEMSSILSACLPYLSARQPELLQQAAVNSIQAIMRLEPDSVWLSLNDLYCPNTPLVLPHQAFPTIMFAGSSVDNNEYATNVQSILDQSACDT